MLMGRLVFREAEEKRHLRGKEILVLGCLLTMLAGSLVACDSGDSQAPAKLPVADESQVDPRPIGAFQFWNPQIGFDVYPWDNRVMSDAERDKDPVHNPAWPYFETCMQASGSPVRAASQTRFAQKDLTAFVAELNRANPDSKPNLTILQTSPAQRKAAVQPGSGAAKAVAFLDCANQWLTKSSKELFEATGVPNEYYPK